MKKYKMWRAENGNVCFCIPLHKIFIRLMRYISVIFIVIMIGALILYCWKGYAIFILIMVLLILALLLCLKILSIGNEFFLNKIVCQLTDTIVEKDIAEIGTKVVKSIMIHDFTEKYEEETRFLLVLLDNETVWKYPIAYHNSDKNESYFECDRNHVLCENYKLIYKIRHTRWKLFLDKIKLSDKMFLRLLLLTILLIGGLSFACFCLLLEYINNVWSVLLLVSLFVIFSGIDFLYKKWPYKFFSVIRNINFILLFILRIYIQICAPFITIFTTYLFVFVYSLAVPTAILMLFANQGWIVLKIETILFIAFSIGSILCTNSYKLTKWIIRISPLHNHDDCDSKYYKEQLSIYLVHPRNVTFLLYLAYWIFLSISGFLQIEKDTYLISQELDTAVLKAFLVFLAFTNMRTKAHDVDLDTKELLVRTLNLFKSK